MLKIFPNSLSASISLFKKKEFLVEIYVQNFESFEHKILHGFTRPFYRAIKG